MIESFFCQRCFAVFSKLSLSCFDVYRLLANIVLSIYGFPGKILLNDPTASSATRLSNLFLGPVSFPTVEKNQNVNKMTGQYLTTHQCLSKQKKRDKNISLDLRISINEEQCSSTKKTCK